MFKLIRNLITVIVCLYQILISPFLPVSCYFSPSCSLYAKKMINQHGYIGIIRIFIRLLRCNPYYHKGDQYQKMQNIRSIDYGNQY